MGNLISGETENFKEYSQFESLDEFNHHMEQWMVEYKDDFSKGELVGLKRLVRFAAKFPGVCNAKIATVLKATHEEYNGNGISRSTFKRMIAKAKDLGIFTIYETVREKNGSQSSNLYIFNRFPSSEPPEQEILDRPKETNNLLKTEKDQKINKRKKQPFELNHTFVSNRVPKPFVDLVRHFFSEAKTIEEYWRMTKIAAYHSDFSYEADLMLEVALDSFRQLIRKMKFTGAIKNDFAYYYGIVKNKFLHHYELANCKNPGTGDNENDFVSLFHTALRHVL